MRYQPEWVDGKTVGASLRDAEGRYEAIAGYLRPRRGFTVLDLGACAGYFSLRLAGEFGAVVTAVDDAPELVEGIRGHPGVTGVFQKVDAQGLARLGHFDVALCLSVLHHVPWWRSMIDMLIRQSGVLFVETADPAEDLPGAIAHEQDIPAIVEQRGGVRIHASPGFDKRFLRPTYVIERTEKEKDG
jgi:2-polyprenyl-3-methyl-5-hydroxy-6-metoxy-1,4-benzoquinol methylase